MSVERAIAVLKSGEVLGLPTETVYGLAGDITQSAALERIFSVKERPFFDPLIVHVDTLAKARALSNNWTPLHEALGKLWPGPLTLITDKVPAINPLITSGLTQVALRIPRHPLALEVLAHFQGLAAPSANKFGKTSPTSAQHVRDEFNSQVFVLDGGACEVGIESTVVAVKDDHSIEIYRPGFFSATDLKTFLKNQGFEVEVRYTESPVAPGQLKHHYMPAIPVLVGIGTTAQALISKAEESLGKKLSKVTVMDLGVDAILAARVFYQSLRDLSPHHDAIVIILEPQHFEEAWTGLMNRLKKAASLWIS